jgi:cytochrome c oxidase subunit IV
MSSTSTKDTGAAGAPDSHEETVHGKGRPHPSDRNYVVIALILAAITAVEIAFYYLEDDLGAIVVPGLIIMMAAKFFIVAAWFMHLRFDSNLFTRVFVSGLVLAIGVYVGALLTFNYWGGDDDRQDETEPGGAGEVSLVLEGLAG